MRGRLVAVAALLIVAGALVGCTVSAGSPEADAGKYEQTWSKSYDETSCSEWNDEMTDRQQWAAAADMLTGARNKGDGGDGLPPDALVDDFQADVTEGCSADGSVKLSEVGASIYLIGRDTYAP